MRPPLDAETDVKEENARPTAGTIEIEQATSPRVCYDYERDALIESVHPADQMKPNAS